jgi:hypothetical protein
MRGKHVLPLVALASLLATPLASADPQATLSLSAPDRVDVSNGTAEATVVATLALSGFVCPNDALFAVRAAATSEASATLANDTLEFRVPAGDYSFDAYEGNASDVVTLSGAGNTTIVATFQSDGGDCIAPGGFDDASANATIVATGPAPAPPPPAPDNATANASSSEGANGTAAAAPPAANATPETNATSAPANDSGAVDRLPTGGSYVGDYRPTQSRASPGPSLLAAGGAVALAALVAQRRPAR